MKRYLALIMLIVCGLAFTGCVDLFDDNEIKTTLTVRFDKNGGQGTMEPQVFKYGETKALSANTFTNPGYTFLGWSESSSAEIAQWGDKAQFSPSNDVTLYAIWKNTLVKYKVEYTDGIEEEEISVPATEEYLPGDKVTVKFDGVGQREGWTFTGWKTRIGTTDYEYKKDGLTYEFDMPDTSVILTAQWEENQIKGGGIKTKPADIPNKTVTLIPTKDIVSKGSDTYINFTLQVENLNGDVSYKWYINGESTTDITKTDSSWKWTINYSTIKFGLNSIMLEATDSDGTYSKTVPITITE